MNESCTGTGTNELDVGTGTMSCWVCPAAPCCSDTTLTLPAADPTWAAAAHGVDGQGQGAEPAASNGLYDGGAALCASRSAAAAEACWRSADPWKFLTATSRPMMSEDWLIAGVAI